jgi:hypothetical protein
MPVLPLLDIRLRWLVDSLRKVEAHHHFRVTRWSCAIGRWEIGQSWSSSEDRQPRFTHPKLMMITNKTNENPSEWQKYTVNPAGLPLFRILQITISRIPSAETTCAQHKDHKLSH